MPLGSQAGSANSQPKIGTCPPVLVLILLRILRILPGSQLVRQLGRTHRADRAHWKAYSNFAYNSYA